jgi:hypothetical protein
MHPDLSSANSGGIVGTWGASAMSAAVIESLVLTRHPRARASIMAAELDEQRKALRYRGYRGRGRCAPRYPGAWTIRSAVVRRICRLEVDHLSGQAMKGFLQRLGQRRVGVDVADQFFDGQIPALGQGEFGQQFGDVGTNQVCSEQLSVRAVGDNLDESGRVAVAAGFSPFARNGNLATAMSLSRAAASAWACASVRPKLATWGWQKVTRGIIA